MARAKNSENNPAGENKTAEENNTPEVAEAAGTGPHTNDTNPLAETSAAPETTETNDDQESVVKSNFKKIRVKDFRGSFGNAKFDDNGVCEAIDKQTFDDLQKHFPDAEVEFID